MNSPWSKTLDWLLESNIFVVLILKYLRAFLPPSATGVRKNRSAIRGLKYASASAGIANRPLVHE